jgi:hypothetical protein
MSNVIEFRGKDDEFDLDDLLNYKQVIEVQLEAARLFQEPLLQDLAWVLSRIADINSPNKQLNLPFGNNLVDILEGRENVFTET